MFRIIIEIERIVSTLYFSMNNYERQWSWTILFFFFYFFFASNSTFHRIETSKSHRGRIFMEFEDWIDFTIVTIKLKVVKLKIVNLFICDKMI